MVLVELSPDGIRERIDLLIGKISDSVAELSNDRVHSTKKRKIESVDDKQGKVVQDCLDIMKELENTPQGHYFMRPVTHNEVDSEYWVKIAIPMDFQTIWAKQSFYTSLEQAYSDVSLVFRNAMSFHPTVVDVWKAAHHLQQIFNEKILELIDRYSGTQLEAAVHDILQHPDPMEYLQATAIQMQDAAVKEHRLNGDALPLLHEMAVELTDKLEHILDSAAINDKIAEIVGSEEEEMNVGDLDNKTQWALWYNVDQWTEEFENEKRQQAVTGQQQQQHEEDNKPMETAVPQIMVSGPHPSVDPMPPEDTQEPSMQVHEAHDDIGIAVDNGAHDEKEDENGDWEDILGEGLEDEDAAGKVDASFGEFKEEVKRRQEEVKDAQDVAERQREANAAAEAEQKQREALDIQTHVRQRREALQDEVTDAGIVSNLSINTALNSWYMNGDGLDSFDKDAHNSLTAPSPIYAPSPAYGNYLPSPSPNKSVPQATICSPAYGDELIPSPEQPDLAPTSPKIPTPKS
eukprot:TRINITY_DN1303_c1_g1_i2.p1 TRINITY_DN1303_c1_g1~~TRINITY_DN1303_c1_g1_i2.p1  ORF type:complete len:518 (+),score=157.57 TRINITY_DN1303_c1_g1_i2:28-1581(+)